MNKLDRQIAIALVLQNRKSISAQQIADYFEISVRTVYRDVQALSEAGIPVVSLPGEGYAIMDGYKLPPLVFDRDELLALHLGGELAAKYGDRLIREASRRARAKIESVLPPLVRLDLDRISEDVLVQTIPTAPASFEASWASAATRAIRERRIVRVTRDGKSESFEELGPLLLYYHDGAWLLIACRPSTGALLDLRLDELRTFDVMARKFEPPAGFTFSRYWTSRSNAPSARPSRAATVSRRSVSRN